MFSLLMQIISTAILMTRSVPEVDYKSQKVLRSKSDSNHLEISNFILSAFFISWISPTPSAWVRRGTPGSAWPPGSVSPDQAGTNIYHIYQICLLVKKLFLAIFPVHIHCCVIRTGLWLLRSGVRLLLPRVQWQVRGNPGAQQHLHQGGDFYFSRT